MIQCFFMNEGKQNIKMHMLFSNGKRLEQTLSPPNNKTIMSMIFISRCRQRVVIPGIRKSQQSTCQCVFTIHDIGNVMRCTFSVTYVKILTKYNVP